MNSNQKPKGMVKSNSDEKNLPLRLDLGGIRRMDEPYARPQWKLIYLPGQGAVFVPACTKVRARQPSDFF